MTSPETKQVRREQSSNHAALRLVWGSSRRAASIRNDVPARIVNSDMAYILIVDSQAEFRQQLVRLLEQAGHRATAVATVSEAPPHPYPWATWAPRRRRHHRVGLESGLNQDNRSTQYLRRVVLAAILALGAAIRCWRLDVGGFIVPYYFAGVRSMMGSWHNFFYNAFDPAGFVSLDKPPVAFWLQTASAKLLGFLHSPDGLQRTRRER
jgi:hypothetical protein